MQGKLKSISFALLLAGLPVVGYASGFQLWQQNGAGTGDYNAGAAAEAADASTAWYNPAGLVMLDTQQLVLSLDGINTGIDFTGNVQNYALVNTPSGSVMLPASNEYGSAEGGTFALIPSFHYAIPINDRVVGAISMVAPFGLSTDYSDDSIARYSATDTSIVDYDLTPSLGVKITNKFSIGAGLDIQYITATLDQVVGLGEVGESLVGEADTDTLSENDAANWALGWHAGILYQFSPATRVGLTYHSQTNTELTGDSTFTGPLASIATEGATDQIKSNNVSADVDLPSTTTLSLYHDVNPRWSVMGTVNYTDWSVFQNVTLKNVAGVVQNGFGLSTPVFLPTTLDVTIPEDFHNTWSFVVGAHYRMTDKLMWRTGIGLDQDPTVDNARNLRLPDNDEYTVSIGAHYQFNKRIGADAGYTHFFVPDAVINSSGTAGQQITYVNGTADDTGNLFGLQLTCNI